MPFMAERSIMRPSIADGLSGNTVAAAADGNQNVMLASETHTRDHVGGTGTARNDSGPTVNHGVRSVRAAS